MNSKIIIITLLVMATALSLTLLRYYQRKAREKQTNRAQRAAVASTEPQLLDSSNPAPGHVFAQPAAPFEAAQVAAGLIDFAELARVKSKVATRENLSDEDIDLLMTSQPVHKLEHELFVAYCLNDRSTNYTNYLRFLEKAKSDIIGMKGGTNGYLEKLASVFEIKQHSVPGMREELRKLETQLEVPPAEKDTPDAVTYCLRVMSYHTVLGLVASAYDGDAAAERYLRAAQTPVGIRPHFLREGAAAYAEQGRFAEAKAVLERLAALRDDEFARFSIDTDDLFAITLHQYQAERARARRVLEHGTYEALLR